MSARSYPQAASHARPLSPGSMAGAPGDQVFTALDLIDSGWSSHLWLTAVTLGRAAVARLRGHAGEVLGGNAPAGAATGAGRQV